MTEDEAKTKVCFRAAKFDASNTANEFDGTRRLTRCIASACMAWRVSDRPLFRHEEIEQALRPVGDGWHALNPRPSVGEIRWMRDAPLGGAGGYCGLAGEPQ